MIHFLEPAMHTGLANDYITRAGIEGRATSLTFEELLDRETLPFGAYVFAGINRLGPAMAAFLARIADHMGEATGIPTLNHPTRSLRRYELIRALYERGLSPYTAYGAWESFDAVRLPAFVRPREFDGFIPELRHSVRALEEDIGRLIMEGRRPEDLVVIEFLDTSVDGVFTKLSAYCVRGRISATSMDRGESWVMRRSTSDPTRELLDAEREYVVENPHEELLREVFAAARIDFGRIDYSMMGDRLVCWEINTLPLLRRVGHAKPYPPELEELRQVRRRVFAERFAESFEGVFAEIEAARSRREAAGEPDPIALPEMSDLREAARREVEDLGVTTDAGRPPFEFLRTVLRPLKPVLKPVASAVLLPILARRARRRGG